MINPDILPVLQGDPLMFEHGIDAPRLIPVIGQPAPVEDRVLFQKIRGDRRDRYDDQNTPVHGKHDRSV